jgi:hypothetical protein
VIARDLQRELARVGCYDGEIHGVWTPAACRAMKAFLDRSNAALPADEPDLILLLLVQAARDRVCGASCPPGQGFAEGGRCMPNAILAGKKGAPVARTEPAPVHAGWAVKQTPAASVPGAPSDGERMGPTGPLAEAGTAPNTPAKAPTAGSQRAADAKRAAAAAQQGFFGLGIFKQFEKLGF